MDNLIIEQYLNEIQLLQEIELISEDISSFIKTFKINKIKKVIGKAQDAASKKNIKKVTTIFSKIKVPTVSLDKLKMVSKKASPEFNKNYTLAKRVLQNSLSDKVADSKILDVTAMAITAKVLAKKLDMKSELKTFILKYRKVATSSSEQNKLKMPPELINEAIIGYLAIGFIIGGVSYGAFAFAAFTGSVWSPLAILMLFFILAWWKKAAEQEVGER
jgi:hypothetical protein